MTELEVLENIQYILACILFLVIVDFSFKWLVKPLMDWFSSLFSEGAI